MPGKEFHKITDWSIERIAYCFELYNGFGYRLVRRIHSPYLWSYSTAYTSGKYVSDGVWSPVAVSEQPGALALLKVMMEMDDSIDCTSCGGNRSGWARAHDDATTVSEAQKPPSAFMTATKSPTVWSIIVAFFTGIWNAFERIVDFVGDLFGSLGDIQVDAESAAAPIQSIFGMLKTDAAYIGTAITVGCLLFAIIRHVQSKRGTA